MGKKHNSAMQGFVRTYTDGDLQRTMDAAVVMPTLLRPRLVQAVESIYAQAFQGRIHIVIGIDKPTGDWSILDALEARRPSHCTVQVFWPGFSTAVRHGGLNVPTDGGATRAILTYLANSPYVAYLDDDNWWDPNHLTQLRAATDECDWGFSLRWFVHPVTRRPICVDIWESVGPGQGVFREKFGGFVDPNCLMFNKVACPLVPHLWNVPLPGAPDTADRHVFAALAARHKPRSTGRPTTYYVLNAKDGRHPIRLRMIGAPYDEVGQMADAEA